MRASVTVSIAAPTIGVFSSTPRQNLVVMSTSRGSAEASCGTSKTSS